MGGLKVWWHTTQTSQRTGRCHHAAPVFQLCLKSKDKNESRMEEKRKMDGMTCSILVSRGILLRQKIATHIKTLNGFQWFAILK